MRRRLLQSAVLFAALVAASFAAPYPMLGPGRLSERHAALESDCFACHAPFRGPDARCVACHEPAGIDAAATGRPAFHAALRSTDCAACHTEHRGREAPRSIREFRHGLLREELSGRCGGCHAPPADALHRDVGQECAACHRFEGWRPATFDHEARFRFDRDHPAACRSCHPEGFGGYTCYGCHEHGRAEVARQHLEEGIADFERCAECHRSADEGEAQRGRRGRGRRGRRDDDR